MTHPKAARVFPALLVAGLVLVAACGSGGGDISTETITTTPIPADPSTTAALAETGDTGDLPEGFPIPAPEGGEVLASGEAQGAAAANIRYPIDSYQTVIAFYEKWASGEGWQRTELGGEPPAVTYLNVEEGLMIRVSPVQGGDTFLVNLSGPT